MKTLKRSLSLVLALVLALSLCSVAFASNMDDYSDADKVTYTEAVDVLLGIKIVDGIGGKLEPTGGYTRAQGAALIARLVLGRTAADKLSVSTAVFTDVPADHWAAGAIAFGVSQGYINGMGDGTFNPDGPLTGYAVAKMVLNALGYGANGEFTGESWQIEVAKLALNDKIDLFKGNATSDFTKAATREEAMLYVFNSLLLPKVQWSSLLGTYTDGSALGGTLYGQLADTFKLDRVTNTNPDAFGRPMTHEWKANGKVCSDQYGYEALYTYTNVSYAKAFKNIDFETCAILENGVDATGTYADAGALAAANLSGYQIELYDRDEDNKIDAIVIVTGFLAQITKVNPAKGSTEASVEIAVYDDPAAAATKSITFTNDPKKADDAYDLITASRVKDDYLVIYFTGADATVATAAAKFISVANVSTVSGKLTAISLSSAGQGSITVGGNVYTTSANIAHTTKFALTTINTYLSKDVIVVLDPYGTVLGVTTETVAKPTVYYGIGLAYAKDNKVPENNMTGAPAKEAYEKVEIFTAEGTSVIYDTAFTLNSDDVTLKPIVDPGFSATINGRLVAYTLDANNKITSIDVAAGTKAAVNQTTKGTPIQIATGVYATATTAIFVLDSDESPVTKNDIEVYTGYNNLPVSNYATAGEAFAGTELNGNAKKDGAFSVGISTLPGGVKSETSYVVFKSATPSISVNDKNEEIYTYDVYLNGVEGTIFNKGAITGAAVEKVFPVTFNAKTGYATLGTALIDTNKEVKQVESDFILLDTTGVIKVSKDTVYYQITFENSKVASFEAVTGIELKAGTTVTCYYTDGTASANAGVVFFSVS